MTEHPEKIPKAVLPIWPGYEQPGTPENDALWDDYYRFIYLLVHTKLVVTLTLVDGAQMTGWVTAYERSTEGQFEDVSAGSPYWVVQDYQGHRGLVLAGVVDVVTVHADPTLQPPTETFVKGAWTTATPEGEAADAVDQAFEEGS